ncbi:MAG: hypothetical protein ABW208_20165 [Pyrinomonadaceae bacterium]
MNLIYSLVRGQIIKWGTKVTVVGGGVAGLTAGVAAAAECCGAQVTVLEQLSEPLALFGRGSRRWLHPHIYEWPREDDTLPHPLDSNAGLPLLNWEAGTVEQVRKRLLEQYKEYEKKFNIDLRVHVANVNILRGSDHNFSLTWSEPVDKTYPNGAKRNYTRQCDVVILAVGFGVERRVPGLPFLSYWSSDRLDEEDVSLGGRVKRILVSGTGDGGLIDLLRIRFTFFSHHEVVERLTGGMLDQPTLDWLTNRLREIEDDAERALAQQRPYEARLNEEYQKLGEELRQKFDFASQVGLRTDTQAVLTGHDEYPLSLRTSILNRLLCSLVPDLYYLRGPWNWAPHEDDRFKVTFADGTVEVFDEIIIRHGPEAALKESFHVVWESCAPLKARSMLDQTRFPIYRTFFDPIPSSGSVVRPETTADSQPHDARAESEITPHSRQARQKPVTTLSAEIPAAVAVEDPYTLVGPLAPDAATYLRRKCDVLLEGALEREPLIAIGGEYQIGKSSLFNRIGVIPRPGWHLCRFDMQGMRTDSLQAFIHEFFEALSAEIGVMDSWARLSAFVKEQPLMLLFDEFGALDDMGPDAVSVISKITWLADEHYTNLRVVACLPTPMSQFVKQYNGNPKYSKPWHAIAVQPLEREEEMTPIFNPLPPVAARAVMQHRSAIWQKSSGRPIRLQGLCDRLFREAMRGGDEALMVRLIHDADSYTV